MTWPKNAETVDTRCTVLILDKVYEVRCTFKVMFNLECAFGSITAALDALFEAPSTAVFSFISVICNVSTDTVKEHLKPEFLVRTIHDLMDMIQRDIPALETNTTHDKDITTDWDGMYDTARFALKMSDNEFWSCTPRRFVKLCAMRKQSDTEMETQQETVKNPEAFIAAFGL